MLIRWLVLCYFMGWCQRLHKVLLVAAGGRGYILILFPILPQEKGNLVLVSWEPSAGINSRVVKSGDPVLSGKHMIPSLS